MLFKVQSTLRSRGYKLKSSPYLSEQDKGQALISVSDELMNYMERRFPRVGAELQAMRKPFADLSTLRSAARKETGSRGEFSPKKLGSVAEARNNKQLADWAAIAEPLITKDPGDLSNLFRAATIAGGGFISGAGLNTLWMVPAAALLFGTRGGQRALTGQLGPQRALAELLAKRPEGVNQVLGMIGREAGLDASQ